MASRLTVGGENRVLPASPGFRADGAGALPGLGESLARPSGLLGEPLKSIWTA